MPSRPAFLYVAATVLASSLAFATESSAQQIVMKVGAPTINDTTHNWMKIFERRVEKSSDGRIQVELYPASALGSIPRMIEGTQLGTIEVTPIPPEFLAGVDPRYALVAAPGIFQDHTHAYRTMYDPAFKEVYWGLGEAKGLKTIGMTCDTPTTYVSPRPIRSLADFEGKKVRVFANTMEQELLKRLGATPAPMPLTEVFPALLQGAIDAARGAVTVWVGFKYYDGVKHLIRTDDAIICVIKNASKVWFDKLPRDLQSVVLDEARAADEENMPFIAEFLGAAYEIWKRNGGQIYDLTDADKAELRTRVATVGDTVVADKPAQKAVYDLMKQAAERTRR
jgi:TRAP-type C4-dicarboxylate transport system substrate-binding protein